LAGLLFDQVREQLEHGLHVRILRHPGARRPEPEGPEPAHAHPGGDTDTPGSAGPRGARALAPCGRAPPGHAGSVAAGRERIPSHPAAAPAGCRQASRPRLVSPHAHAQGRNPAEELTPVPDRRRSGVLRASPLRPGAARIRRSGMAHRHADDDQSWRVGDSHGGRGRVTGGVARDDAQQVHSGL
jgi:hypothetical protein